MVTYELREQYVTPHDCEPSGLWHITRGQVFKNGRIPLSRDRRDRRLHRADPHNQMIGNGLRAAGIGDRLAL